MREGRQCPSSLSEIGLNSETLAPLFYEPRHPDRRQVWLELGMNRWFRFLSAPDWSESDVRAWATALPLSGAVLSVELSKPLTANILPNDFSFYDLYHLNRMHCPEAWDIHHGDSDLLVTVIDCGVKIDHEDLAAGMYVNPGEDLNSNGQWDPGEADGVDDDGNGFIDDLIGWDFATYVPVPGNELPGEEYGTPDNEIFPDIAGHGTHCSGIMAAMTDNGLGVASVAWNVKALHVRAAVGEIDSGRVGTTGYDADFAAAIQYAVDQGSRIVSISYGAIGEEYYDQFYQDAVLYARAANALVFASSGNHGSSTIQYPAGYDGVIAVASTDGADDLVPSSGWGDWVDCAAPGDLVWSTFPNSPYAPGEYSIQSGTSMASPNAAAVAALIMKSNPSLTDDEVETVLLSTCHDYYGGIVGAGLVDAEAALEEAGTPTGVTGPVFSDSDPAGREFAVKPGEVVRLLGSRPNPALLQNWIEFDLATRGEIEMVITDIRGRLVRRLSSESMGPGKHHILWDGTDGRGLQQPPGIYLYRLRANGGKPVTGRLVRVN